MNCEVILDNQFSSLVTLSSWESLVNVLFSLRWSHKVLVTKVIHLGVVGWGRSGGVGRGVAVPSLGLWGVDRGSLVGHLSDETVVVVSGVGCGLDTAIGKSDHVGSSNNTIGILGLSLLEVSLRVVISYTILVGVGLRGELLCWFVGWCWVIGWGRGAIGWRVVSKGSGHNGQKHDSLEKY